MPNLSARERRALIAAIDPIPAEDVSKLFIERGASQGIIEVLSQAVESECMGIRLAMVAYFAALKGQSKRLVSAAIKALREGPVPGQDDFSGVCGSIRCRARNLLNFSASFLIEYKEMMP